MKHPRLPKLVIGSNQALMALANRSPKHLEDPLPEVSISRPEHVTEHLGLDPDAQAALTSRVSGWMDADSYSSMRKAMIQDLRGVFPEDVHRRQAVARRAVKLWSVTRGDAIHRPHDMVKALPGALPQAQRPKLGGVYAQTGRIGGGSAGQSRGGLPVGTVRKWKGRDYQKQSDGTWQPVKGSGGKPAADDAGKDPHAVHAEAMKRHRKIAIEAARAGKGDMAKQHILAAADHEVAAIKHKHGHDDAASASKTANRSSRKLVQGKPEKPKKKSALDRLDAAVERANKSKARAKELAQGKKKREAAKVKEETKSEAKPGKAEKTPGKAEKTPEKTGQAPGKTKRAGKRGRRKRTNVANARDRAKQRAYAEKMGFDQRAKKPKLKVKAGGDGGKPAETGGADQQVQQSATGASQGGAEKLKAAIGQMVQQHGKKAVAAALNGIHGEIAEHLDHTFSTAAATRAGDPAVQKVVKKKAGGDVHKWQTKEKVQEMAGHLAEDPQARLIAEREVKKAMPEIVDTAAEAVVNATDGEHPEGQDSGGKKSKVKAIARLILKSGAGSFAFGFIDNFMLYMAGSAIDDAVSARGFSAAATAGIGNAISDAVGEAGSSTVEKLLSKFGLGEEGTQGALSEKTERRVAQGARIAGVFAGALAGMVPLLFGVSFGKSMDEVPGEQLIKGGKSDEWISKKIAKLIREGKPRDQAIAIAYSMAGRARKSLSKGVDNPVDSVDNWVLEVILKEPGPDGMWTEEALLVRHGKPRLLIKAGGPFIGPKGGKWQDPQHTIPWKESTPKRKYTAEDFKREAAEREKRKSRVKSMIKIGGEYKVGEDRYLLVLPDAAHPGKVRTQSYDSQGFSGHRTYDNLDKLKESVADEHHRNFERAEGALEKLSTTKEWSEGMARTHVIAALNSLGYYGKRDDVELINRHAEKHGIQATAAALSGWNENQKELTEQTRELLRKSFGIVEMLVKAAGHKYVKRVPTGRPKPKYRYYYRVPGRKGLVASDDIKEGAKVKMAHEGKEGHFEIKGRHEKTNKVILEHDESGKTIHVHENDLQRMVQAHHLKQGKETVQVDKEGKPTKPKVPKLKLRVQPTQVEMKTPKTGKPKPEPTKPKGKPVKLQETDMAGLQDYDHVIGFAPDESRAQAIAQAHGDGEFGIVKQPGGYVVAVRDTKKESKKGEASGDKTKVFMRDKSGKGIAEIEAEFVVMDASKIIASHNPLTMAPREDYPEGVQERRYHELTGEKMKVSRISRTLNPSIVANTSPTAIDGAPVVTEDGIVLGGNGRTMAMQLAYARQPESAEKLKDHLVQYARQFGMRPEEVKGIKQPILVRRVKAGKDTAKLRALGRRMNEALTQGLDPRTAEVAMGQNYVDKNLTGVLVAGMDHDQTLGEYLHSPASRDLIKAMEGSGIIDDMNRDEFVDQKTGILNEDGRMRIERILAARMLPDATILSNMNQKARESIARSVPSFLRAEAAGWDIRESLMTAVKADIDFKSGGHKGASTYLRQVIGEHDPDNPAKAVQEDPTASMLFQMLQSIGPKKTPAGFREFARRAEVAKDSGGSASLFGGEPPETMDQALDKAFGISPEAAKANRDAVKAAKDEEKRLAAEFGLDVEREKRRKKPTAEGGDAGTGEMFAASIDSNWHKAMKDENLPAYLMDSICREVRHQVEGQLQRSAVRGGGAFAVDGAKVKREVMAMLLYAMGADETMARAVGASPPDGKTIDGLIQAFSEMHAPKLKKAVGWWSKPKEMLQKAGGPFIGPRGGKWADPQHTIPWTDEQPRQKQEEKPKRKWVEKLEHLPDETHSHYKDDKGNYKPERKKLHDEIVKKFSDHVPSTPEGKQPEAVVMMGGPASGKTTAAKKLGIDMSKYVNINPDDVKEHLPEYNEAIKGSARNAAFMAHKESSEVATRIHKEALEDNKNLLVDGTGKSVEKYTKLVKALKQAGYKVRLVMADIDTEEAYKRMVGRAESSGRYVPDHIFTAAHEMIPGNFHAIAEHADEAQILNNSGKGPELAWSKKGGKEQVHHEEHYKAFKRREGYSKQREAQRGATSS